MLRMDPFLVAMPSTIHEASALLAEHGDAAKLCAGGTDVIPNMKHGLHEPAVLVHLSRIKGLSGITDEGAHLRIGALTTLATIEENALVRQFFPALAHAAHAVAGPQLRQMGTLGGNICLDTRCLYYNQTYFWREALGFCLKKDGTKCHVVEGGKRCVAAASNDTATMLTSLDAVVMVENAAGMREIPLSSFYVANGAKNNVLQQGDIVVAVLIPKVSQQNAQQSSQPDLQQAPMQQLAGYSKLRHRQSIDFPMLSVGVRFDVDLQGVVQVAKLTVSALASAPNKIDVSFAIGRTLDDTLTEEIAALAHKRCNPLTNICDDPQWRKEMVPVYVKRAIDAARTGIPDESVLGGATDLSLFARPSIHAQDLS